MGNIKVYIRVSSHIHILFSSIWSASTVNSQSLKVLINICHVQGFPFPVSHSSRIFVMILFGFPRNSSSMLFTSVPVLSLRRNVPNALYSAPTFWGIFSSRSFGRVGTWSKTQNHYCSYNTKDRALSYLLIAISLGRSSFCEGCSSPESLLFGWLVSSFPTKI